MVVCLHDQHPAVTPIYDEVGNLNGRRGRSRVRAICLVVPPGVSDCQADDEHNSGDDCDGDHEQYSPTRDTHDVSFRVGELRTWRGPRAQNLVTPPCAETGSQPSPLPCHAMPRALAPVRVLGQVATPRLRCFAAQGTSCLALGCQTQMSLDGSRVIVMFAAANSQHGQA
jgi:hypothetical protein